MMPTKYPYFETKLWTGRLPAPPQLRGTSMAKLFTRGSIGGTKIDRIERFENTPQGRARLITWARQHQSERFDVEYVVSPKRSRVAVPTAIVFRPGFQRDGVPATLVR